jgi:hypothetical protein
MTTDYNTLIIIEKDSGKQINFPPPESNVKPPPYFSGIGSSQELLKFVEDFEKSAQWNNWRSDIRKKEIFLLCLTGQVECWAQRNILSRENYTSMAFDVDIVRVTGIIESLVIAFKKKCTSLEQQRISRCYNCSATNHYQHECPQAYKVCKKTDHTFGDYPVKARQRCHES